MISIDSALGERYHLGRWDSGSEEAAVDWKIRYVRDRETELARLSETIDLISRLVSAAGPENVEVHVDDLVLFRQLRRQILEDIEELGWIEPRQWLTVSSRIEHSLRELREAVERSSDWFSLVPCLA